MIDYEYFTTLPIAVQDILTREQTIEYVSLPSNPSLLRVQQRLIEMIEARCMPPTMALLNPLNAWEMTSRDIRIWVAVKNTAQWGERVTVMAFGEENTKFATVAWANYTIIRTLGSFGVLNLPVGEREARAIFNAIKTIERGTSLHWGVVCKTLGNYEQHFGAMLNSGAVEWTRTDDFLTVDMDKLKQWAKSHVGRSLAALAKRNQPHLYVCPPYTRSEHCLRCNQPGTFARFELEEPHPQACRLCGRVTKRS